MREVFIDTNIVLDYLAEREPHTRHANALFEHAIKSDIVLNICSYSYATAHYVLRKKVSHENILNDLDMLSKFTKCLSVSETIIRQALKSQFHDFEDAIQYFCAMQVQGCEAIITRDAKGFKLSTIPVVSPAFFLSGENIS